VTRVGLTQRVSVIEAYGERRDCLDQQWTVLLEELDYTPVLLPNCVTDVENYLDSLALDAVVITSGNDLMSVDDPATPAPERDEFEKATLQYAIDNSIPVLGICRGLELINEYFGGSLTEVTGHVACTHPIWFTDTDVAITFPDRATVNSYHNYGIDRQDLGDDLIVVGTSPDDTVECITHESLPVWGIMWHPERESPSEPLDRQILNGALGETKQ